MKKAVTPLTPSLSRLLAAGLLASLLTGCATPQEKAINAYCANEAATRYPAQLVTQTVERPVKVGERTRGTRSTCRTVENVDKRRGVKVEETVCTDEPIREAIYETRWVQETVDLNQTARNHHHTVCSATAQQNGLFKDVR